MKICSGSLSLTKAILSIAASNLRGLAIRVQSSFLLALLRRLSFGWLSALMSGRIRSMFAA